MGLFGVILLAAVLAMVPTLIYATIIWWLDRYEKEPLPLIVVAFLWGAVPAVILALVLEIGAGIPLRQFILADASREFAEVSFIGPVVEESVKAIILVVLFIAFRREFDDVLDGIIYGAMVGLGFAMVENILYLTGAAYDNAQGGSPDIGSVFSLWVLRAGLFGLNHSMFTSFTGAALGLARSAKIAWQRGLLPVAGLGAAMLFHGIHNSLTQLVGANSNSEQQSGLVLGACLAIVTSDFGGILLIFALALISSVREGHVIRDTLLEEVSLGRFTPDEYDTLISGRKRWAIRWAVLFSSGFRRWRQLGKFFDLSTELAFRKHHLSDGDARQQSFYSRDVARLRQDIDALKMRIVFGN